MCASWATVTTAHAIGVGDIEQVVEGECVVIADGHAALVSSCGFGAAVICIDSKPERKRLAVRNHQITVPQLSTVTFCGFDLNVSLCRGDSLEVF